MICKNGEKWNSETVWLLQDSKMNLVKDGNARQKLGPCQFKHLTLKCYSPVLSCLAAMGEEVARQLLGFVPFSRESPTSCLGAAPLSILPAENQIAPCKAAWAEAEDKIQEWTSLHMACLALWRAGSSGTDVHKMLSLPLAPRTMWSPGPPARDASA